MDQKVGYCTRMHSNTVEKLLQQESR